MTASPRMAVVKKIFDSFQSAGDIGPLLDAVTDDVRFRLTILPGTPVSGEFVGKEGLKLYFERSAEVVALNDFVVSNYLEGGDDIAVVGNETRTALKSGLVERDGYWVTVLTFRGDKISRILVVHDCAAIWASCR